MTHKQKIRASFKSEVFKRDKSKCKLCAADAVDAHHITDRSLMPNGGYVKENGIAVCSLCHLKAEQFHITGIALVGYEVDTLYKLIGSHFELAYKKSQELKC